jgi:hypothetical protein
MGSPWPSVFLQTSTKRIVPTPQISDDSGPTGAGTDCGRGAVPAVLRSVLKIKVTLLLQACLPLSSKYRLG